MKAIMQIPSEWADTSKLFIALGDEQRQRILLAFEPDERLNIGQIVAASTLSRTAVSHHLRVLRESGALQSEKVGKEVFFHINKKMMTEALEGVLSYIKTTI
ncbi:metalloregulator ArsR/SmtB family transcription factor [Methylovorus menthalis]|uniref:ArsR/SmtB family transcription factor n=1 Tax=Methylovorus menthalis TaxID=1002227 RepID=UPI001E4D7A76|nr:metalloregulator ArsR/SmtB family transcription factor [Methylovorus menthalis]MCB4810059.1 metalloregulator ArsR/SmtB family transcription factor [Methylovorus menthalis]